MDYKSKFNKWEEYFKTNEISCEELEKMKADEKLMKSAFEKDLKFGTAGLRGIMGPGTNRMNLFTVKKATQGFANYLNKNYKKPSVVIGYDSRNNSENFAKATASVFAANNIKTFIYLELTPVATVSYAVMKLNCSAGVMITASHNPREYNGYKVFNHKGCQILDEEAKSILHEINSIDCFSDVKEKDFNKELNKRIFYIKKEMIDEFVNEASEASNFTSSSNLKIIYTPLNGSGLVPVGKVLNKNNFKFFIVPEQEKPNGDFPTCTTPNPERRDVYDLALKYAQDINPDIIIATDADCDRIGVMIPSSNGYRLFSGNEIGILLFNYICETSEKVADKYLYSSIISTIFTDKIAQKYKVKVKRPLNGFKNISKLIDENPSVFLFGFEESNGYLIGEYTREKDGVVTVNAICKMAAYYKDKNLTLLDVLNNLYKEFGYLIDETVYIDLESEDDGIKIMKNMRNTNVVKKYINNVVRYVDYKNGDSTIVSKADMVKFTLDDDTRIMVRPSGTEPKIKVYISAYGDSVDNAKIKIEALREAINKIANEKTV